MAACYQPPGRDTQSKQHYCDSFCSALTALSNSHLLLAAADFNDLSPQRPSQRQSCLSRVLTCFGLQHLICEPTPRASLKPMQPMHLHWAPRFWGLRATVFRQIVHFFQIPLARIQLENSVETAYKSHC